ncbi:WhiB family transcriptional regulator [Georgenia sp. SYP-B2076]|uniref:WhiB family transcriptional regulator n=1 Tax=Georgenia sp. SYP-B2076 TaxID=2495881 RepID=UPI000F8E8FE0|nr:WhiB family transcriptional regulator [Georgenia sp. SYP-B2076]
MWSDEDESWARYAACADAEPDALFVRGAAQRSARALCLGCAVRMQCLAEALDSQISFGVWGGLTERERRALLRRFPDVDDWRVRLAGADPEGNALIAELRSQRPPRAAGRPTGRGGTLESVAG